MHNISELICKVCCSLFLVVHDSCYCLHIQIWKYPKLWVGFLKCAIQTKPQSFSVLLQVGIFLFLFLFVYACSVRLTYDFFHYYMSIFWINFLNLSFQLPAPQLENALSKNPILKAPLGEHASQPQIRSALPR